MYAEAMVRKAAALGVGGALVIACGSFVEGTPPPTSGAGDSGDAGSPADAAHADAPSACPQSALVCEDFESGLATWAVSPSNVSVARVPERGHVLLATLPSGGVAAATIRRSFSPTSERVRLSFALRVADPKFTDEPSTANYAVATLSVSSAVGPSYVGFYLGSGADGAVVHPTIKAPSGLRGTSKLPMSYGEWHRITVEMHFAETGSLSYQVDGLQGGTTAAASAIGPAELSLGLVRQNDPTPALAVEIDDVLVEGF